MQFIKDAGSGLQVAGFGIQVAVLQGYLAAVKGHNVVKSMKALGDINKDNLKDFENYKHVGGRVLQTPFFLVGMVAGIVMDLISLVVNGAKYIGSAIYNLGRALKAHITGEQEVPSEDYYALDFAGSHKNFVDPKNVDTYNTPYSLDTNKTVQSEKPIAENVTLFNTKVANAASEACKGVAKKLGFGGTTEG